MSQTQTSPQQRRSVRADIVMAVKYRPFRNDSIFKSNFSVGRSQDVSAGGLKLAVGRHNPVASKLDMELELPNGSNAYVSGNVLRGEDEVINGITHHYDKIAFSAVDKESEELISHQVFEVIRRKGLKGR